MDGCRPFRLVKLAATDGERYHRGWHGEIVSKFDLEDTRVEGSDGV
jgi:hypothetical protein